MDVQQLIATMQQNLFITGAVAGVLLFVLYSLFFKSNPFNKRPSKGKFSDKLRDPNASTRGYYDVAIVGAGPSGSTCAYYMSKAGANVLLLEKAPAFPRDKYCGDAVCKTAIEILMDMGVYDKLIKENKAHVADAGGLVSPSGLSYIGRSHEVLGAIPAAVAVKRLDLDEAVAMAAKAIGADLKCDHAVADAKFDKSTGLWTVTTEKGQVYKARVLVCADGAPSKLAIKLGIVQGEPQGTCSRAFIEPPHSFDADGVVFYNKDILPGYAALFKHPNNVLNYCCYLIPGNPKVRNEDLQKWHEHLLENDPILKKALGSGYKIEPMRPGSLRMGGVQCSWAEHCIVIGDAAGMIDPMTGEGIHHAFDSGRIGARFLLQCMEAGNYSAETMKIYHDRWMHEFGSDFEWSMKICQFLYHYPIFLDAATAAVQRKGNEFLARWADIMTGRVPKFHLLHPKFTVVITFELLRLLVKRAFGSKPKSA